MHITVICMFYPEELVGGKTSQFTSIGGMIETRPLPVFNNRDNYLVFVTYHKVKGFNCYMHVL